MNPENRSLFESVQLSIWSTLNRIALKPVRAEQHDNSSKCQSDFITGTS